LEVSRITRGKIEVRKEPVELVAVLGTAVETSRPLIEAARHQLAIQVSPETMTLLADPVRLAQVVSNLLNNAAKYTEEGGQIWLSARREGQEAVICVRDNGMGISGEMLPRVFEMFAQVDCTLQRAQGGLGIGLTLAKNLVQMHEGCIEAHSEGPGKGSEFIVRLPLMPVPPHSGAEPPSQPEGAADLPRCRVLVVDDTRAAVFTLGKLLEAMGQRVFTAQDANSALACAREERPDVVFSDIGMPGMDGYELARRLRHEPGLEKVVLVALTGYGQDSDRQKAKEAGFDFHLVKPVGLDELREVLSALAASPVADRSVLSVDH
jgi:CheY-like chemotaxis protein/anti-sigma regulatory factor (Ser/Thr protein kinase)